MIPIPPRMAHLRVERGMAVPYNVVIGKDGTVHFAINDERLRRLSIRRNVCSICGKTLFRGRWLVGGPLAAFHPDGAFIDPPMHSECAHYALQVCPYLAAPRYAGEVGLKKAAAHKANLPDQMIVVDSIMHPGRPAGDIFVALMTTRKITVFEATWNMKPKRPYDVVEYWRHGKQITKHEGERIVDEAVRNYKRAS
jgi:hypothetical protein